MPATQSDRPFRLKTNLGDDALLVDSFTGHEGVSQPFGFIVKALSEDPNIDMKSLLVTPAVLSFHIDDEDERHIHGLINSIRLLEFGEDGFAAYELEILPWVSFLNYFSNCRIFQNKSVPDIIEQIFSSRGFSDYRLNLQGSYNPREYCVQYRETDFNFISRLMEDEGIFYYFEQTKEKHTMVLCDASSAFSTCPHTSTVNYMPATGSSRLEGVVSSLQCAYHVAVGTATLADYDFTKPNTYLYSTLAGDQIGEFYDYPGGYATKDDGDRYSRVRLEEREAEIAKVGGRSTCMAFECGYKFTLQDHYRDESNQEYVLTRLDHSGANTSYRSGSDQKFEYANSFVAIPSSVVYRPPRVSVKPVVKGTQTALVVGKSGEEIWVDQYGRIKVQFYWDREGVKNENSSCWIRVAQGWAGKQWGAIHIPRIGQEVLVTFLEGDPDRPLIAGSVYNADQTVPYALPDEQTKSTVKSYSSKGGGGFNEFRFEDKKGSEQVFLHGEKDLDIRIKNDRKEWIGQDRHLIVTRDKREQVQRDSHVEVNRDLIEKFGRDHHLQIDGKEAIKITGSHSLSVTGDVIEEFKANHSSQVTQNLYLKAMQVVIEASVGLTLKVGGNFITIDPSGVAIKGTLVQINSGGAALSGSAGSLVSPLSATDPLEADKADPGSASTPSPDAKAGTSMSASNVTAAAFGGSRRSPATDAPAHDPNAPENREKKHWIEIELLDEEGNPVSGEPYRVTLPDGQTVADGTLDDKGRAKVQNIDPGTCKVTFPNLDRDAWK